MKKTFILLFLVLVSESASQTYLDGSFSLEVESSIHGEKYTFRNDGNFEYFQWGDLLPNDFGRGNYEIRDSVLTLNFIDIPEMHNTVYLIDNDYQSESDTVIYEIQVFDFKTKLPVQYGAIKLRYKSNYIDTLHRSVYLIEDYLLDKVVIFKSNFPESMNISSLGGGNFNYEFKDSLSRNMRVYLKDMTVARDYIGPKQEILSIRNITTDSFELYKYNGWFQYRRIEK